ncbi:hypothetical protein LTS17_010536 [Exophiala oligosperma]
MSHSPGSFHSSFFPDKGGFNMSNATTKDYDDDEYVAKLLAEDARQSSIKYASQGMSALLPKKTSGGSGLKPNTRFLKTLVREADSHNAALKKREEFEARARLRAIKDDRRRSEADRRTRREHDRDERHRYREERPRREPERKRRRLSHSDYDDHEGKRTRHSRDSRDSRSSRKTRRSISPDRELSRTRDTGRRTRRDDGDHDEKDQSRHRSRQRRRQENHKSLRLSRSRSRSLDNSHDRKDDIVKKASHKTHRHRRQRSDSSTPSDPLRSMVGPIPLDHSSTTARTTTTKRGRGFTSGGQSSNIDAHFDSNYDPSLDVGADLLESDDEAADWDNALEALRDRRAWREKQVDRLREAGFDDDQIRRWESSTTSKSRLDDGGGGVGDPQNVTWSKKGEQREWDVGKKSAFDQSGCDDDDDDDAVDDTSSKATEGNDRNQGRKRKGGRAVGEAWRGKDNGLLKQFRSALG